MILIIFMLLTACNNVRPPGLYFTYDAETDSYIVTNCSDIFYDKSKYYIQSSLPGAVTIPTEYHGKPVTGISERAFLLWINMTSINIPDTVTSIGNEAFEHCDFTEITIPDSVTTIGQGAFSGCGNLTDVKLSTKIVRIESSLFYGCFKLKGVNIPDGVTYIGAYAFDGCAALERLFIPIEVKSIEHCVFRRCNSLTVYFEEDMPLSSFHTDWNGESPAEFIFGARCIKFDPQGGSDIDRIFGLPGDNIIYDFIIPERQGYTFNGWYALDVDTDLDGVYEIEDGDTLSETEFDFETNKIPLESITLYAKWTEN